MIKEKRKDWTRIYHKTLKRLEVIIDVQRQVKDMMKIAAEANISRSLTVDFIFIFLLSFYFSFIFYF